MQPSLFAMTLLSGAKGLAKLFVLLLFVAVQSAPAFAQTINAEETKARVIIKAYDDLCVKPMGALTEKVRASLKGMNAVDQDLAYQEAMASLKKKGIKVANHEPQLQENLEGRTWSLTASGIPLIVKYENNSKCHVFIPSAHQATLTEAFKTYVLAMGKSLQTKPSRISQAKSIAGEEQIMFRIPMSDVKRDMFFAATFRPQEKTAHSDYGLTFTMIPRSLK